MSQCVYQSPVGTLLIKEHDGAVISLDVIKDQDLAKIKNERTPLLDRTVSELDEYFQKKRSHFTIPLSLSGTAYQMLVWEEMKKIPYGKTMSYGELATRIGNKNGARSVGMACARNPIMILVPCHRVIGKSGRLTGFGGGLPMKEQLLLLENNQDWKK